MSQTVTQFNKDINWLNLPDAPKKVTVKPEVAEVNDLFKKAVLTQTVKPTSKPKLTTKAPVKKKKVGVVGISKAENEQLGRLLKWIALDTDWDTIPTDVLTDPEALTKLFGRFKTS